MTKRTPWATDLPGLAMIAMERKRQIEQEGWTPEHDDEHSDASLALAAICYAAPVRVYVRDDHATGTSFSDPWPDSWDERHDKRARCGNGHFVGNSVTDPETYTHKQRIDLLKKAGALIAAEIDRQLRAHERSASYSDGAGKRVFIRPPL